MDVFSLILALLLSLNEYRDIPLVIDDTLTDIASIRSTDMAERNYFSHYNLEGTTVRNLLLDVGYTGRGVELLCRTNNDGCVTAWLQSPTHGIQALNENYRKIGIGIATDQDGLTYYSVLMFGDD